MGRPGTIAGTAVQGRVDALLDAGASLREVSTATGVHPASVQRYKALRNSQLVLAAQGEPNGFDLIGRLAAIANDARDARIKAKAYASPSARANAIKVETSVIDKMLTGLGIDDVQVAEDMASAGDLALIVGMHVLHDSTAVELLDRLDQHESLSGLAQQLRDARRAG